MERRAFLGALGVAAAGAPAVARNAARAEVPAGLPRDAVPTGLRQSVCRWPYADIPLAEFCRLARAAGVTAVDLLHEDEWAVAEDAGLRCSTANSTRRRDFLTRGVNDPANHALILGELERVIPRAAQAGIPNVIAMFGNRAGKSDADGIRASVEALRRIAPLAEEQGVTVLVELLNSKVDHPDYQGDHTPFGVAVMREVGSPRVRLLYDIYHMQVMEGDVIATIRAHHDLIGHYHTAGVPGRHELDGPQELNYAAIARAIADTGFAGWLAHEFVPTRDAGDGLRAAVTLCA